jgi:hypothetical protein
MKKLIFLSAFACLAIASCKKDDPAPQKTTAEKVLGSWKIQNVVFNDYYSNADHITTTNGSASDFVEFRNDGKSYSLFQGFRDTSTYSVPNDNSIILDGETFSIKTLTDNQFTLYNKEVISTTPNEYEETTINLAK